MSDQEIAATIRDLRRDDRETRHNAANRLVQIGDPAVGPLIASLMDENPRARDWAVGILRSIGAPAVEGLVRFIREEDDEKIELKRFAAATLNKIGSYDALRALIFDVNCRDRRIQRFRWHALTWLSRCEDREALPILRQALTHPSSAMRSTAIQAVGQGGDLESVPTLLRALKNPRDPLSSLLLRALYDVSSNEGLPRQIVAAKLWTVRDRYECLMDLMQLLANLHDHKYHGTPLIRDLDRTLNAGASRLSLPGTLYDLLHDGNEDVRDGAREMIHFMELLRGSEHSKHTDSGELLRCAPSAFGERVGDLLVPIHDVSTETPRPQHAWWRQLWFWKQRNRD